MGHFSLLLKKTHTRAASTETGFGPGAPDRPSWPFQPKAACAPETPAPVDRSAPALARYRRRH